MFKRGCRQEGKKTQKTKPENTGKELEDPFGVISISLGAGDLWRKAPLRAIEVEQNISGSHFPTEIAAAQQKPLPLDSFIFSNAQGCTQCCVALSSSLPLTGFTEACAHALAGGKQADTAVFWSLRHGGLRSGNKRLILALVKSRGLLILPHPASCWC